MKIVQLYNKKGFTLMELLVTVILVAVLASFSVYHYNNTIDEGKLNAAKGKLAALGGAVARYFVEHGTLPCTEKSVNASYSSCGNNSGEDKIYDIFACGEAEKSLANEENFNFIFGCPSMVGECGTYSTYTVMMKPKAGVNSEIFPKCAYFDMSTDKIKTVES